MPTEGLISGFAFRPVLLTPSLEGFPPRPRETSGNAAHPPVFGVDERKSIPRNTHVLRLPIPKTHENRSSADLWGHKSPSVPKGRSPKLQSCSAKDRRNRVFQGSTRSSELKVTTDRGSSSGCSARSRRASEQAVATGDCFSPYLLSQSPFVLCALCLEGKRQGREDRGK
jgi:hypothetical protein